MASYLKAVNGWFWNDSFWLPPGVTWDAIAAKPDNNYPDFNDMYHPIAFGFCVIGLRLAFEWLIARPIGRWWGLPDPGSELPNIFKRMNRKLRYWAQLLSASESPDKCAANGDIIRIRRDRPASEVLRPVIIPKSKLDKFCECSWRFCFYSSAFGYGLWALWDKSWFSDPAHCFIGYPFHPMDWEIDFYYKFESAFYWALMLSQFTDVQRKDFEMMFVHHIATLSLMWFSWGTNFVRIGSLIMVIHDAADLWLELAKIFKYIGITWACDASFAMFAIMWFITRCGILPYYVLYSTFVEAPALVPWYPVYFLFNGLILVLQILHMIWSYMIGKVVYQTIINGEVEDVRSDDEDEPESFKLEDDHLD